MCMRCQVRRSDSRKLVCYSSLGYRAVIECKEKHESLTVGGLHEGKVVLLWKDFWCMKKLAFESENSRFVCIEETKSKWIHRRVGVSEEDNST